HTRFSRDWSSDVCSSDLTTLHGAPDIVLVLAVGGTEGLHDDLPQRGAAEIVVAVTAVDGDPAAAGLDPDAGDGILAPTGRISARSEERRVGKEGRWRWAP